MADMIEKDKPVFETTSSRLFVPLSTTENGLAVVSPSDILRQSLTYDVQVLVALPFAAEMNILNIDLLFDEGIVPKGPIVDIGCGAGVLVEKLREKGYLTYGIEILRKYGQSWRDRNIGSFCYVGNLEDMPGVRDDSFTLVTTRAFWDSAFGTEGQGGSSSNDPRKCIKEINRILGPGGAFLMLSDNTEHFGRLTEHAKRLGLTELKIGDFSIHNRVFLKPRD